MEVGHISDDPKLVPRLVRKTRVEDSIAFIVWETCGMNAQRREWTDLDFESLSWHDNQIHGLRLHNPDHGYDYDLVFDIDHILNWNQRADGTFGCVIAPATLAFHHVSHLECRFTLTYKERIWISHIDREPAGRASGVHGEWRTYRWRLHLQPDASPPGYICFHASGFTLRLTKDPIEASGTLLTDDER